MRILTIILSLNLCFWLVSCEQSSNISQEQKAMQASHVSMPMQHLTMLLEHAIGMMAQGAELKLQGQKYAQKHGDAMLAQSADLLRRAMSGPEMAAMHKGGQGHSPAMQHTHDLGAAAFDLLDMMMSLQANSNTFKGDKMLHHALNMAAQGASMRSLAVMGMSKDIDVAMQDHGLKMQEAAIRLSEQIPADTAYQKAVLKVIHLLTENGALNQKHMH